MAFRIRLIACLLSGAWLLVACQQGSSSRPAFRVDYVSPGTFRWGSYQGLSLISVGRGGIPPLSTDGQFFEEEVTLLLAEDQGERRARTLPVVYQPPGGDAATVDFSRFLIDGTIEVTRRHFGIDYLTDFLETRSDGLDLVGHEAVPLSGDLDPEDIIRFGNAYFTQDASVDLAEAQRRFFLAGVHYPELALRVIAQHENRAEDERNPVLGRETLRYRQRFELLLEWPASASEESESEKKPEGMLKIQHLNLREDDKETD